MTTEFQPGERVFETADPPEVYGGPMLIVGPDLLKPDTWVVQREDGQRFRWEYEEYEDEYRTYTSWRSAGLRRG